MPPDRNIPNNVEIDKALREFEMQKKGQAPTAPEIPVPSLSDLSKMVRLVMKLSAGAIKEQKTTEYVLLGFVVLTMALAFYLIFGEGGQEVSSSSRAQDLFFTPSSGNLPN